MTRLILLLSSFIFLFSACDEVAPVVTGSMGQGGGGGGPVAEQKRQVLIEEFTGVRCVNCPAGSAAIEDLLAVHGEQLVAVSIHAGEFAPPYPGSEDFRTPEGDQILSFLGEPFGYPTAVVNRRLFDGQFDLQLGQGEWAGYILEEKDTPPKVRIGIETDFNASSRNLEVKVALFVDEDITEPDVNLSIMLTESGIEDLQLTPSSSTPQADYVHKHVLRDMITNFNGEPITEALVAGAEINKTFSYTLPEEWKEENCEVIAFVSLAGANKDVLQAHQAHVVE